MRGKGCHKNVESRDTETGDPARLPAQVARQWRLGEKVYGEKNNILYWAD